jgi:hypothetical protein
VERRRVALPLPITHFFFLSSVDIFYEATPGNANFGDFALL